MNKDDVRRSFPRCIAVADQVREVFGDGVKLLYAEENGRSIGTKSKHDPDSVQRVSDIVFDVNPESDPVAKKGGRGAK